MKFNNIKGNNFKVGDAKPFEFDFQEITLTPGYNYSSYFLPDPLNTNEYYVSYYRSSPLLSGIYKITNNFGSISSVYNNSNSGSQSGMNSIFSTDTDVFSLGNHVGAPNYYSIRKINNGAFSSFINPSPLPIGLYHQAGIYYKDKIFISTNNPISIYRSDNNGSAFTKIDITTNQSIKTFSHNNTNMIVGITNKNIYYSSDDGNTFSENLSMNIQETGSMYQNVYYNSGIFILTRNDNVNTQEILTSVDGINWNITKTISNEIAYSTNSITYGNNKFVILLSGNKYMTSENGSSWGPVMNLPESTAFYSHIVYNDNKFIFNGRGSINNSSKILIGTI